MNADNVGMLKLRGGACLAKKLFRLRATELPFSRVGPATPI